ncbi:putative monovalent cation/H+ antiporter subunit A [Geoalkalibacter sp.]|uniref:putative monovalent cation/H+ antiporter subunit A n=1 Tax=Geoalkalibacter sp. TaxID=3041440 RepID=UPI00272E85E2|nr:putative monovalent cation/H+ antiporter subunit A [Geoalkalibacter sp.]
MIWAVLAGFFLAPLALLPLGSVARWRGGLHALLPLGLTLFLLRHLDAVAQGRILVARQPWVPGLGIDLSFYLDGLSLLFALLITGVGTLVMVYAGAYLHGRPQVGRFFFWLTLFMASMLGLVLAGNVLTLFIFWELTSLTSFFLIGFDHEREGARQAALQALLVTALGGAALLAGLLVLGQAAGGYDFATLLSRGEVLRAHPWYLAGLLLVLGGAFTKSAQVPFHFWLPSAMEAPTPVSAYLHSVTMVKAGVYLLARLHPVLGGTSAWFWLLVGFGGATLLTGAWLALWQSDMKRILAYTTVSALGGLILLLGIGSEAALHAALVYLLAHALYKGALFLTAGAVDHAVGSRDVNQLRGLARSLPLLAAAATAAALSMAGLPPLLGFVAKEALYRAALAAPAAGLLTGIVWVSGVLLVAAAALLVARPFFAAPRASLAELHAPSPALWLGPVLLAAGGLLCGLAPGLVNRPLLTAAGAALTGGALVPLDLALWHGFDAVLLLSLLTLAAGVALYLNLARLARLPSFWRGASSWGAARLYDLGVAGLYGLAYRQTRLLQNGYLRSYILTLVGFAVGLTAFTLVGRGLSPALPGLAEPRLFEGAVALMILCGALFAVFSPSRLSAVVAMGTIGYGVALIFVEFGAPDLAMTQFVIETMTVILFVLSIHRLPTYLPRSSRWIQGRDAVVAIAAGGLMTLLMLLVLEAGGGSRVADFFAEQTWPAAHGRDIVNVILVDFRAMDTLGEIAVLTLAGVGVHALLRLRAGAGED